MDRIFYFTAISKIGLTHRDGEPTSKLAETSVRLEISKNLDKKRYLNNRDLPTEDGIKPMQQAFIQGIMTNIKFADKNGWWKEAEHMQYVIDELQRAYVAVAYSDPNIKEDYL